MQPRDDACTKERVEGDRDSAGRNSDHDTLMKRAAAECRHREITHGGTQVILERYRRGYSTPEAMGVLTFSEIEVRPLAPGVALATGKYSLTRTAAGGGDSSGRFTLILRRGPSGWKIIHDHSN